MVCSFLRMTNKIQTVVVFVLLVFFGGYIGHVYLKSGAVKNTTSMPRIENGYLDLGNSLLFLEGSLLSDRDQRFPRIVNKIITEYRQDLAREFQSAVDSQLAANHPRVINLVREMMDKPSSHMIKLSLPLKHTPQSEVMAKYLKQQGRLKDGFFIECGALDGERSSNTIYLEQEYGWTGLLIEVDPFFYTQLMGKNRRSWSINACLSPSNSIQWMNFQGHSRGQGQLSKKNEGTRKVPCFPFESYMLALERTTVDFFSLDIEGWETPVLNSINYTAYNIATWAIEHPIKNDQDLIKLMTEPNKGYKVLKKVHDSSAYYARDVLFVK